MFYRVSSCNPSSLEVGSPQVEKLSSLERSMVPWDDRWNRRFYWLHRSTVMAYCMIGFFATPLMTIGIWKIMKVVKGIRL